MSSNELYGRTAREAAAAVISAYSTSFGLATSLLGPRVRPHVRNIYALVRVADEIVDGAAADAGLPWSRNGSSSTSWRPKPSPRSRGVSARI